MQKLSVSMIVKNEAEVIERSIRSALPWVDEIVVVDTGSTDSTKEIARSLGAAVYDFKWIDDFSAARNYSLSKTTGDWILWLDADDILPEETGFRLRNLAALAASDLGLYHFDYSKSLDPNIYGIIRSSFFRKHPNIFFTGRVHEQLILKGYRSKRTGLKILHIGKPSTPDQQKNKEDFYLRLLRQDSTEKPDSHAIWFHLAMTAMDKGDINEAEIAARHFFDLTPLPEQIYRAALCYSYLIKIQLERKDKQAAEFTVSSALESFQDHPLILLNSGEHFLAMGNFSYAKKVLYKLLDFQYKDLPDLCSPELLSYWRFQRYAETLLGLKEFTEAIDLLENIYSRYPENRATVEALVYAYTMSNSTEKTKTLHLEKLDTDNNKKTMQSMLVNWYST